MNSYVIRKLERNCWLDALEFQTESILTSDDVESVIVGRIRRSRTPLFGCMGLCLIWRKPNGRESQIGKTITLERMGQLFNHR